MEGGSERRGRRPGLQLEYLDASTEIHHVWMGLGVLHDTKFACQDSSHLLATFKSLKLILYSRFHSS